MPLEGRHKVGQINDLVRDLLPETEGAYDSAYIITYSDIPRIYWKSSSGENFMDIPEAEFGGRSNLGAAYTFIGKMLEKDSLPLSQACLVLISDGAATDNYKAALEKLDPKGESARVAGCIGNDRYTLADHVGSEKLVYPNLSECGDRNDFFDEIVAKLENNS